jgi:hypothetical protein
VLWMPDQLHGEQWERDRGSGKLLENFYLDVLRVEVIYISSEIHDIFTSFSRGDFLL